MDAVQLLMLAMACASVWLGRWNGTCWALALAYFAVQAWWMLNQGRALNPGDLFMVDLVTVLLIYCKAIARETRCEFESGWEQFVCFATAPTRHDRLVLIIFPLGMWPLYVANVSPAAQWRGLFWLATAQFLIAGAEAIDTRRKANAPTGEADAPSSGLMRVAWAGAGDSD